MINMAFSNYLIYSDLMKQLSASQPSEMAVSLVSSSPSPVISAPSPLKRHLEPSPLKHIVNPGAIDLNSPVRLLSESIVSKMNNSENSSILEPVAKKLKLNSSPYKEMNNSRLNNNTTAIFSSKSASIESLKNGIKMLSGDTSPGNENSKAYSCGWMSNTSPMRHPESGDAPDSPQPPTLNPITSQHSEADEAGDKSPAHLPTLEPPPLLIKPIGSVNSPSRSSTDGEISLENTDPNADPMEGHEVCPECQKVFKRKIYLQRHMEREHWSTAKVFKCEDCNYETKHQSNLSVHRRTHTGERPYHCGACGQRYTQGHLLKSHIRSRHGGNMQFYNLDKKSDSTRGRKSLDIKHDIGVAHRQDKISTLLQAAAAATGNQNTQAPKSPFGGLMSPNMSYMSSLAPYYGLQQGLTPSNLSVRPMMASSLALNAGLLGGSRFFALGGLANGLPTSSMLPKVATPSLSIFSTPSSMPLTSPTLNASSLVTSKASVGEEKHEPGLLMKAPTTKEHSRVPSPVKTSTPSPKPVAHNCDDGVPQDLSIKHHNSGDDEDERRSVSTPPRPSSNGLSAIKSYVNGTSAVQKIYNDTGITSNSQSSLVISSEQKRVNSDESVAEDLSCHSEQLQGHNIAHNQAIVAPPMETIIPAVQTTEDQLSECRTPQSISAENDDASAMQDQYNADESDVAENDEEISSFDDSNIESRDTMSPKMIHYCGNDGCSHANQLTKLRKNVMRMLRCFAPEFSENNIDYSTVEVDQLLYDVMFSNIDEKILKK